jgi:hypothetical protein
MSSLQKTYVRVRDKDECEAVAKAAVNRGFTLGMYGLSWDTDTTAVFLTSESRILFGDNRTIKSANSAGYRQVSLGEIIDLSFIFEE